MEIRQGVGSAAAGAGRPAAEDEADVSHDREYHLGTAKEVSILYMYMYIDLLINMYVYRIELL